MKNKAEAAYYRDKEEDSIAIMKDRIELASAMGNSTTSSFSQHELKSKQLASIITNQLIDKRSIVSSVTWETILSKQSQTKERLNKIDMALDKIFQFMQLVQTINLLPNNISLETGS